MSGAPSRRQHKQFCDTEGWQEVANARGRPVRHHLTYELALADGRVLRTRVSRPANNDVYGPSLWSAILRDQLDVTEAQFWDCVRRGVKPPRPGTPAQAPERALPAGLVYQLVHTVGVPEAEVAQMTREQAIARMAEHWSAPPPA